MPSNAEEKENRPESVLQEGLTMAVEHEPVIELNTEKEIELGNSKTLKRKSKNESTDDPVHLPMSENVNVLNKLGLEVGEPSAKKKCELDLKQNKSDLYRPYYSIVCPNFLFNIEIISQLFKSEDEFVQNWELVKLKSSTNKLKREDPQTTLVKFQPKNFKSNELIEQNYNFYIGDLKIKLFNIGPDLADSNFLNQEFKFYVYESVYEYESLPTKLNINDIELGNKKLIEAENREHFLIISNFETALQTNSGETNFFLKFEKTPLISTILRLTACNHIHILVDELELSNSTVNFSLKLFLPSNSRNDLLINSNPSFNYSNSKVSNEINFVMSHFFPILSTNLTMASFNHKNNSDDFCDEIKHRDESEIKNRNENLFDLIYELHKETGCLNEMIGCGDDSVIQELSYLKPALRPYQINGIKWMLFKENFSFDRSRVSELPSDLHPLYLKLVNKKNDCVYYHKFYGIVTNKAPLKLKSLPGGILADEMGLGKTLEILSLIMLNPRCDDFKFQFEKCQVDKNRQELNKKSFSCLCGNTPESFQADSFKRYQYTIDVSVYQCVACMVWTHVKCVNYRGPKQEFLCLECCTKVAPIKSGCTLIVTPSVISYQWADEIKKHVDKKLNVLVYKGTGSGFIQPRDLASLDICITTYDVLSNELAHVFAIENQRSLRKAKRFSNIPSPLIYVEWWRICLDEAQMVHSTNSRCAEMASRLHAINRWCVTGTPIGRSLGDLHGLFTFIREDPYINKKWFKYCLFEPFQMGDKMPMAKAVSNVLWRTSKRFVEHQINIPKQTEICYWIDFSPFEAHLYQRVLEIFRNNRKNSFKSIENTQPNGVSGEDESQNVDSFFSKYLNGNMRLDELERSVIDQVRADKF